MQFPECLLAAEFLFGIHSWHGINVCIHVNMLMRLPDKISNISISNQNIKPSLEKAPKHNYVAEVCPLFTFLCNNSAIYFF